MPIGKGTNFFDGQSTVQVALTDASGNAVLARGTVANLPSSVAGYAVSCIYQATDSGAIYENTGTAASCTFTLMDTASTSLQLPEAATDATTTTGTSLALTQNTVTTGAGITQSLNGLTTGFGHSITHTTSVIANGGSLLNLSSTGIDTSTTTGVLLNLSSTASTAGTQVLGTFSGLTTGNGVRIVANALTTGNALDISTTGLTAGGQSINVTASSASTDAGTSVEPILLTTTMTGAGGVGGRFKSSLTTNVALGSWSNAIKGEVTYGATGKTTGLGSAIVSEMTLSAGTADGTYAPLEIELNLGTGALTGTATSLIYASVNGADAATFDANGFILNLAGLTAGAGDAFQTGLTAATINAATTAALKIKIGSTTYYIPIATATA